MTPTLQMNSTTGNSFATASRRVAVMLVVWCAFPAMMVSAWADAYAKIEASFNITNLLTDPFDYTVTDVRVQIVQPDSSTLSLPAFFDGGTTWRVRHTPMRPGLYQVTSVTLNGMPLAVNNLQPAAWTVADRATGPGFVRVDSGDTNRFITSNGRRFFPVGHNVAWWTNNTQLGGIISKLGASRENWSRIWMTHFYDSLNLEWPKVGSLGQYSLPVAQKWDAIVAAAEQGGVHFQMTLQHHGQYSTTVDPNWNDNPYNTINGGFLSDPKLFFTDATARSLTKRKLRYIVARWGYSPAIMAWELFNEVQFTSAGQAAQWSNIAVWHDEMAAFLRVQDAYQHLVTTSSDLSQLIWNSMDYYQYHNYASDIVTSSRDAQAPPGGSPIKPNFAGECGPYFAVTNSPRLWVQAALWPSLMAAPAGAACPWWWDYIDAQNDYSIFRSANDFVRLSGLADQNNLTKSTPTVTGGPITPLAFAPGGGWGTNNGPDIFTVGNGAPDGIGAAPSYLQGNFHRVAFKMTNGYTFLVNYPTNGTFSVQITQIAAAGAGLQVFLDGIIQTNISFPATASDVSTNFVASISISAGAHSVKIYNPGQDWVLLGNLTLNPYVPTLGAYAVGNSGFNATWLWHRTNLFNLSASSSITGTVAVAGLAPGNYDATWWDTFSGVAISNFNFTVVGTNVVTLATPPVLRSVALFAGTPPQAGINTPVLAQTLGTNSPPLTLPLMITNTGGLPLSYSLSVTGFNAIAYSSINSTESGGPVFAWKDISAIGRDLTTDFTALTGKNAKDEGIAGPIDIGFGFPFFSGAQSPDVFTQLYVSPNGFITFNTFSGDTSTNKPLPSVQSPANLIAFFWDDLDFTSGGRVYVASNVVEGAFTLQFQDARFKGSSASVTCQLILKSTGEILMQYKSLGVSNACTVGVQYAAGDQGLQVAYNQNFLQNNFAVRLRPTPWLDLDANAGLVPRASADTVNLSLDAAGLTYGTYSATLLIQTGDATQPLLSQPVTLNVTPIATWRQSHFGAADNTGNAADTADPEGDGLINIVEYAFNSDPLTASATPLSFALINGHLTVSFRRTRPAPADLNYIFEVSDDLSSGIWNSGPGYTSQSGLDNLDGTETVTVSDNATAPSPAAHFLRIRLSH
ncbi:MAG: DUF5060 domain-containing protein [Verrucomicrobia bacterium]|nr:DUF5060 domain-containing protein [Verrucomicrobiota bacterium]